MNDQNQASKPLTVCVSSQYKRGSCLKILHTMECKMAESSSKTRDKSNYLIRTLLI